MKKAIYVMLVVALGLLASCSKDSDEPKRYATESEIQGKWFCQGPYANYLFTFDKPIYTTFLTNGNYTELEQGTYTMGKNGLITFHPKNGKESAWSTIDAYWEGTDKTQLHLYPVGTFVRAN